MVSWVPDLLLPGLVALAFIPQLDRRWVMAMAPTTYLADLDYVLPQAWADAMGMPHLHRVVTHTLVLRALIVAGLVWAWWRLARGRVGFWSWTTKPGWPLATLLLVYYLTAHSVMDVFTGGVVLFWPLSDLNVFVDARVLINLRTGEVTPHVEPGTSQGPSQLDPQYEWLSNEHAAMLALVLLVLAALGAAWAWRGARRGGRPRDPPAEVPAPAPPSGRAPKRR
jgi:hypothetical protein